MDNIEAISPIDGRYSNLTKELKPYFSEKALIDYRIKVEMLWLIHILQLSNIQNRLNINNNDISKIIKIFKNIPTDFYKTIKQIEKKISHDVKAVEYGLQKLLISHKCNKNIIPLIHFACTSEDINNLAYGLMLKDVRKFILLPHMDKIIQILAHMATEYSDLSMLSRTHGQPAIPTTLGKELAVFGYRLLKQRKKLAEIQIEGKFNGAVGNFNAHSLAFPDCDWIEITRQFVEVKIGLNYNLFTTQIENHDSMIEYFDILRRFNQILIGFCQDIWAYVAIGYLKQKHKSHEVGSSTMPHKINPINFENAEGNLGLAVSLAHHYAQKLLISRWQRDLSDSTVLRTIGTMFAHSIIAYKAICNGLSKIQADNDFIISDLQNNAEVLSEGLQVIMKSYGQQNAYELFKNLTRGKKVNLKDLHMIIDSTKILNNDIKTELKKLTPLTYTGYAKNLALNFANMINKTLKYEEY